MRYTRKMLPTISHHFSRLALLALASMATACTFDPPGSVLDDTGSGDNTPDAGNSGQAVTWTANIKQIILADNCTSCHGTSGPEGNYSLDSYSDALGNGSDGTANVIAGDASSKLIQYFDDQHHTSDPQRAALVKKWIVDGNAAE